jgi:hypothetical protein
MVYCITHGIPPFHFIFVDGRHIHHLVFGILILLGVGYAWLCEFGTGMEGSSLLASGMMSILYGVGAALTLDEFVLWLNLKDVYWSREGRSSIDAVVLFGALLAIGTWGRSPLHKQADAEILSFRNQLVFLKERIRFAFLSNGGQGAVPGHNHGVIRESQNAIVQRGHDLIERASWEVRAADTSRKQSVTRDQALLRREIEADASFRMPRRLNDARLQLSGVHGVGITHTLIDFNFAW